jgi:Fe-S-cluster containining protein
MSHNCLECAEQGRDCCREAHSKFLTLQDARRIAEYLGEDINSFAVYGGLKDEDREEYIYINKHQSYYYDLTLRDDRLLQLKHKSDGSCMFQEPGGRCAIYQARPLICRTYPFWLSDDGEMIFDGCSSDCPVVCAVTGNDDPDDVIKLEDATGSCREKALGLVGYSREAMKAFLDQMMSEIDDYRNNIDSFIRENRVSIPALDARCCVAGK